MAAAAHAKDVAGRCPVHPSASRSGTPLRWRRVFPGAEVQVRELRRWLTGLLPECAARDDVTTIGVELAANAVAHTASGQAGNCFVTEVTWYGPLVRISVADSGGPNRPRVVETPYTDERDGFDEHGRGLKMVQALAARTGVIGDALSRTVWAEVRWPAEHPAPGAAFEHLQEEAINSAEWALRQRFGAFVSWYGRQTLEWWAAPKRAGTYPVGLVHAASAAELAELLTRARQGR